MNIEIFTPEFKKWFKESLKIAPWIIGGAAMGFIVLLIVVKSFQIFGFFAAVAIFITLLIISYFINKD